MIKKLTTREVYKTLQEQGYDIAQNKIEGWANAGVNIQDKSLLTKMYEPAGKFSDKIRNEKVDAILNLIKDVEADPKKANKGFKEYIINTPSDNKNITLKNIMAGVNKGTSTELNEALGKENIEKLNKLFGKYSEDSENVFSQYIPIAQKKPNNLYNTGIYKLRASL